MKYVIGIIQPAKLEMVREALASLGVSGMTVGEVQGYGRQKGKSEIYRGAEYAVNFLPKVKLELAIDSDQADAVVKAIKEAAHTDKIGDGKIFVLDLVQAVRIRTGETGKAAL